MTAVFVSDLHLVAPDDEKTQLFVRFLGGVKASHVFLVGDIFDLWVSDHAYFAQKFANVVEAIRRLTKCGVEVHYFEGNHDLHLEKFWSEVGVQVHADDANFELGGIRVRVEHGDLINPDDKGYLFLRGFLRSGPMTFLAHHLPSRVVQAIGERASHASRDYTSNSKGKPADEIRSLIRAHAERVAAREPFDLIISGHVHVADDFMFEANGRQIRSVNLGSWFEKTPRAFVLSGESDRDGHSDGPRDGDSHGGRFVDVAEIAAQT